MTMCPNEILVILCDSVGDLAPSSRRLARSDKFPLETQSNIYFERLCQSYPMHPEIFGRFYEDWLTLKKFQRTL